MRLFRGIYMIPKENKYSIFFVTLFLVVAFLFGMLMFSKSKKLSDESIIVKKEAIEIQKETNKLLKELIEELQRQK